MGLWSMVTQCRGTDEGESQLITVRYVGRVLTGTHSVGDRYIEHLVAMPKLPAFPVNASLLRYHTFFQVPRYC
jgi:hypothetical protein